MILTRSSIVRLKNGGLLCGSEGCASPSKARLEWLQSHLSSNLDLQHEINSYLLACSINYYNPPIKLVLNMTDTFHYYNLPNLFQFLQISLSSGNWSSNIVSCFMSIFVLQLKKTKKSFTSTNLCQRTALINLLHGLLLGLYPFNMKTIKFENKVRIVKAIRNLFMMNSPLEFILNNEALISVAMIEYLSNVLADFWCVEHAYLIKTQYSRLNINQICESMRSSLEPHYECSDFWPILNQAAQNVLPALHRQMKLNNAKIFKKAFNYKISSKTMKYLCENDMCTKIVQLPVLNKNCINVFSQIQILCPEYSFDDLQCVEAFWTNIRVFQAPKILYNQQTEILHKYRNCNNFQESLSVFFMCFQCALKANSCAFQQKFAFNCILNKLMCTSCSKEAVKINLIGKILCIADNSYLKCNKCLSVIKWDGKNYDCLPCRQKNIKLKNMSNCFFCHKKTYEITHKVINLQELTIEYIPLCFLHTKTYITSTSTVYDLFSLKKEFGSKVVM